MPASYDSLPIGSSAAVCRDLVSRITAGDESAREELRAFLAARPLILEVAHVRRRTEEAWLDLASGGDPVRREALIVRLTAMRSDLLGPSPQPIEHLLVDLIVLAWLETQLSSLWEAGSFDKDCSQVQRKYLEQRVRQAHRRMAMGTKHLALVRRLLGPVEEAYDPTMEAPYKHADVDDVDDPAMNPPTEHLELTDEAPAPEDLTIAATCEHASVFSRSDAVATT
jgi:hypothetical protein